MDDATNADRAPRRVAAQAAEVTRRRRAWVAARGVARQLKEDYDAAVFELYAAIAAEIAPLPPSSAPEGGPGS
jgi:4'-phosphopantetheinyl transferase EntD